MSFKVQKHEIFGLTHRVNIFVDFQIGSGV